MGFLVFWFWPFFKVFHFWCLLQFAVFLSFAVGFQILAKIQAVFQTWYPMFFPFFLMYLVSGFSSAIKYALMTKKVTNYVSYFPLCKLSNSKNFPLYSLAISDLNYGKRQVFNKLVTASAKYYQLLRLLYTFTGVLYPSDVVHPV